MLKSLRFVFFLFLLFFYPLNLCFAINSEADPSSKIANRSEAQVDIPRKNNEFIIKNENIKENKTKDPKNANLNTYKRSEETKKENENQVNRIQSPTQSPTHVEENKKSVKKTIKEPPPPVKPKKIEKEDKNKTENSSTSSVKNNNGSDDTSEKSSSVASAPLEQGSSPYLEAENNKDVSHPNDFLEKRSYIVRGIISMMLVVAGAVLLVIVIVSGYEKKSKNNESPEQ